MGLGSFPEGDLPARLSHALFEEYIGGQAFRLPDWYAAESARSGHPLTAEQRILGLATIWSEAKYNFAYWDRLPGEAWWDDKFLHFLPRVSGATSDAAYWQALQEFAQLLRDGHTGVRPPAYLGEDAQPALRIARVEERLVVIGGELLPRGTEILAVDGQEAAVIHAACAGRIPSSTSHYAQAQAAAWLLRGPVGRQVTVQVHLPDGRIREVVLDRSGGLPAPPPLEVRDVGGMMFHVVLTSFGDEQIARAFHERFSDFRDVRGLIFDLRRNSGGSSAVGYAILARVLRRPCRSSATRLRVYIPTARAWGLPQRWLTLPGRRLAPDVERPRFVGPVAVLSGPLTASAAEDFLVAYKWSRRGPIVGEASSGSTGQPLLVQLPGGGVLRLCTKRDTFPDGTDFVGRGVSPDIPSAPTVRGITAGRDEVLDQAIAHIRGSRRRGGHPREA